MDGKFVKVIGVKFDPIEGLTVVFDNNNKDFQEAGILADKYADSDTIFIGVPCVYSINSSSTI